MPQKVLFWKCLTCGTLYPNEVEAKRCEQGGAPQSFRFTVNQKVYWSSYEGNIIGFLYGKPLAPGTEHELFATILADNETIFTVPEIQLSDKPVMFEVIETDPEPQLTFKERVVEMIVALILKNPIPLIKKKF